MQQQEFWSSNTHFLFSFCISEFQELIFVCVCLLSIQFLHIFCYIREKSKSTLCPSLSKEHNPTWEEKGNKRKNISKIQKYRLWNLLLLLSNKFNWNSLNIENYLNYYILTVCDDSTKPARWYYFHCADEGTENLRGLSEVIWMMDRRIKIWTQICLVPYGCLALQRLRETTEMN